MRKLLLAAALVLVAPMKLNATPLIVGGGWQLFSFSQGNTTTLFLEALGSVRIRVVDAFCYGDVFSVAITGGFGGNTSAAPQLGCGGPNTGDAAWADPNMSKGEFFVGAGAYDIDITPIQLSTGFTSGGAFIRADAGDFTAVPEPATLVLLATGLAGLAGAGAVRRRGPPKS